MELPPQGENETSDECLDKVLKVFREMDVHVPYTVIDRAHRIGRPKRPSGIRQQWKGQRNLLDFRFQVKGSVSPIHTKLLMIATSILFSKWAFSNSLEGVALKHFSWGKTPVPHPFLFPLPQLSFSSAILGLLLSIQNL